MAQTHNCNMFMAVILFWSLTTIIGVTAHTIYTSKSAGVPTVTMVQAPTCHLMITSQSRIGTWYIDTKSHEYHEFFEKGKWRRRDLSPGLCDKLSRSLPTKLANTFMSIMSWFCKIMTSILGHDHLLSTTTFILVLHEDQDLYGMPCTHVSAFINIHIIEYISCAIFMDLWKFFVHVILICDL